MAKPDLEAAFQQLRTILEAFEPHLVEVHDQPGNYYLDSAFTQAKGRRLFFGSVRAGKQHVSYHLMPVYLWPELLDGSSDQLRRRMQGKSCFNFKKPDPRLLEELSTLTRRGFERYRAEGYVR